MNYLSTTTPERFYHVNTSDGRRATVFFRQREDGWLASAAVVSAPDIFCRKRGRSIARRKWFAGKNVTTAEPSYDEAVSVANYASQVRLRA